ncbi:General transcription and DNA repair factor IIH subunit [Podosphaera aphanis]|nr:General transcription and DNA repair factor IIH subunit [Podosphaera aphanis]
MASTIRGSAAYKKKDGILSIANDQKSISWLPLSANDKQKAIVIHTPESAAKVMLRIIAKSPGSSDTATHQFHFNSPTNPRGEANSIKDVLTTLISAIKANDTSILKPSASTSELASNTTSLAANPITNATLWASDTQLKSNIELQQSLMKSDPTLHRTYVESRRTKSDTISDSQFNSQFWSTRTTLLRAHAIESSQKRGAYNVLSAVKPRQVDGELKMNISAEQVQLIFSQHPLVKRIYDENVPKLNDMDFWSRFFLSRLFKKLKGERIVEADSTDPIFDKYLDANNDVLGNKLLASHIPHIIDLEGNEENQGGNKGGNRKDFTMRPGSTAKVPIIRTLNSLSEKIMAHVAPSDINPSDPIGMSEQAYRSLALHDLKENVEGSKIVLNLNEQSKFYSHDKDIQSAEASVYARNKPAEVLSGLQADIGSIASEMDAAGELDLSSVIGVVVDSDSEDENEKIPHVGSKASLLNAQKHVLEDITTRRCEISVTGPQSLLSGLSQKVFDRITLTHATTIEFLHHFWTLFLSGNPDQAGELATMVETLERAIDRISAVADDAEKERQQIISKQKQHVKDVYKSSGRKIQWSSNSVPGGSKAVRIMTEPTLKALQKATEEYKNALALEQPESDLTSLEQNRKE